ncbi:unannotated protein [freshwater metagenome]|uniref:Unannotated protein n=2 Tax=freshwater metagenome TaxID=449393 RepID=A0A6J7GBB3_9ZZZZ|nr:hypothetical protein [Actinomycetota bacterium]MSY79000.1 hypothetical protein [Actinomycetota bacterium]
MMEFSEEEAQQVLRLAPSVPSNLSLFSSNTLFGQPGIYPEGPPMHPAVGPTLDEHQGAALLRELLEPETAEEMVEFFTNSELLDRVPDPSLRAALLLLGGGPAEAVLRAFLNNQTAVKRLGIGLPNGEGRVIGSEIDEADPSRRVLNLRYKSEHPAAIAPSLAHALCHHEGLASNAEEATLHGLLSAAHIWLLAHNASLATMTTELFRRQASLSITLLNARSAGSWLASIRCPNGPGTIPGGNPALQCPDLWSIPFTATPDEDCDLSIPLPVQQALSCLAAETAGAVPDRYCDQLGEWFTQNLGQGRFFGAVPRAQAGQALGLLNRGDTPPSTTTQG